jgi:MFS family permease
MPTTQSATFDASAAPTAAPAAAQSLADRPAPPQTDASTLAQQGAPTAHSLWRSRSYWVWLLSDTGQAVGSSLQFFLIPLLVVLVSGDAAVAGTVAAIGLGGRIATTLVGGVLADRHDLRRLMVISGLAAAVVVVAILAAIELEVGLVALAALNLLAGVRAGLLGGASNAALKQVVRPEVLPTASAANQARDAAVSMGGAPLGGVLLGIGAVPALGVTAAAYLVSAASALLMKGDFRPVRATEPSSIRREIGTGLRWLWSRPELRRVMAVALLLNLGLNGAVTTLLYHLATTGEAPARIGLVSTALGLGMLLGALVAGQVVQRVPSGWVAMVGLSLAGLSMVALPFAPDFWSTLAILTVGILGAPSANAAIIGYLMHQTPRAVLGRVMSAVELVAAGAMPLAPILAGWGLAAFGLRPTLLVCAVICLVAVGAILTSRALRSLPRPEAWSPAAE